MSTLHRSQDRIIAGVCGALARVWHMDVTLLRALTALGALLLPGVGRLIVVAYIVLWVVLPEPPQSTAYTVDGQAPQGAADIPPHAPQGSPFLSSLRRPALWGLPWAVWAALALIALGVYFLIREITGFDLRPYVIPVGLIVAGALLLAHGRR